MIFVNDRASHLASFGPTPRRSVRSYWSMTR